MKIIFLDETGDHSLEKIDSQYPVFGLAGVIIDEDVYKNEISPAIDEIKLKYWKSTDIVLHSREIRKCEPPFNNLLNASARKAFYNDLNNFFENADIKIISSVILKERLVNQYHDPSNPYAISTVFR